MCTLIHRDEEREPDTLTHKWWEMKVNAVKEREKEHLH